ncbi:MAG TPA: hypothetical protein VNS02_02085 [Rhizobiaceae bacterium]|nr:hypothetical protein [Rhizobiaceae bacterium]
MADRIVAASIRKRISDAMTRILVDRPPAQGLSSKEVVSVVYKDIEQLSVDELRLLARLGIAVVVGRTTSLKQIDPSHADMLENAGIPRYASLRRPTEDGRHSTRIVDVSRLTPNEILMHSKAERTARKQSRLDTLLEWAAIQVNAGKGDLKVEDCLK